MRWREGLWGDRRHDKVAGVFEADEASVEQVVDAGRQQQSILPIEPFQINSAF